MKRALGYAAFAAVVGAPALANADIFVRADVMVGVDTPTDITAEAGGFSATESADVDSAVSLAGAVGKSFSNNVRTELELNYARFDGGEGDDGAIDFSYLAAFVNIYYDFSTDFSFQPYVGGGVGVARGEIDADTEVGDYSGESTGVAWHADVGVTVPMSGGALDLGYRYLAMPAAEAEGSYGGVDVTLKLEPTSHQVRLGYRFDF